MTAAEELLNNVRAFVIRYVWFPTEHHAVVVALWIAHTWTVNAFYTTPRLILDSAEPGSGKTRVLELLALLSHSAKLTLSTTTAALYRRIAAAADDDRSPPTVLQDESDAIFGKTANPQTEDLRALYNSGYKRGASVDRCEGDAKNMRVREFPVFAPVALAGLAGRMPDTITTRAVTLHMRRRRPGDQVAEYRERDAKLYATPLSDRLELWASESTEELAEARPEMPDGVRDRAAEVWEPLLAIADHAGGQWPEVARRACRYFVVDSAAEDERLSIGQRLLRDLKLLLDADGSTAMWSSEILAKLKADPESEWRDLWGKPLDERRLAKELSRYGIKSKTIRIGVGQAKGYAIDGPTGLLQAWDHWLTPSVAVPSVPAVPMQVNAGRTGTDETLTVPDPSHQFMPAEQQEYESGTAGTAGTLTDGIPQTPQPNDPRLCPDCRRAPARTDTGLCDFCTAKMRRQQTRKDPPRLTCEKWFVRYVADLRAQGVQYHAAAAAYAAGTEQGFAKSSIANAIHCHPDVRIAAKTGRAVWWCIDPTETLGYVPVAEFVEKYLDQLPTDASVINQTDFYRAADAAGIDRHTARKGLVRDSGRIDSQPAHGRSKSERVWIIRREDAS